MRSGFRKGPEDSPGCYLLDCLVHHPTWQLLPGLRGSVREELVREGLAWISTREVGAAEELKECGLLFWEGRDPRADTDGWVLGPRRAREAGT